MTFFAIFQAAKPVPIAITPFNILPRRVSNSSAQESISSVRPSQSFIFLTISSTLLVIASPRKSYSGNSKPRPPAPPIPPAPPAPLSSGGAITFNSSIPRSAVFSSFAFFAAFPRLSAISAAPPAPTFKPL